jgi:hypothetical protein
MTPNFQEILLELSYRIPTGIVDLTNQTHINELIIILEETGIYNPEAIRYLMEKATNDSGETFTATKKDSGETVAFQSKAAKDAAIEDGTHIEPSKSDKESEQPSTQTLSADDFLTSAEKNASASTETEAPAETKPKPKEQATNVDRSGFDTKNKNYKDAPGGPTQQEILDDLNKGNLNTITKYQNEVESNREKGIAGAGGPVASEGESKFCHAINNFDVFKKENSEKIQTKIEELSGKKPNAEETKFANSLGLEPNSDEFLRILSEREVFAEINLKKVKDDQDSVFHKPGKTGFAGIVESYTQWMKAAYAGGLSTINRLNESKLDTSRPYKVVQSTTELNDAVQSHLEDTVANSEGADRKYYEHQLKLFKKFKNYHDTFTIGKDKNGRTKIVSISNKKDSEVKDPQNNTTPAQRLRLMQIKFGDDVSDGVSKTIEEGIQKVSNAAAATVKSQAKIKIDDSVVAACESPKMKKYVDVLDGIATDGKHKFSKYIQSKGNDWENLSTGKKLELMNEYSNSRLYDEQGNSRIVEKDEGTFYKDDTGKEIGPIKNLGLIGLPYEPFGKISIKLGEFGVNKETVAIKQAEKDIVTAVHTEVTQKLFEDDEPNGYHPDKRPNADNGKHTQAYISGVMDAMHLGTYIDLDDEDDDAMLIQMGFNGIKPSMIRNCVAEQSGYTGDVSTTDGKNGLKEHLLKKSRITPGGEKVSVMNEGKEVELFNDQWRTAGTTQKVASYFGKDMRGCLQSKAKKLT